MSQREMYLLYSPKYDVQLMWKMSKENEVWDHIGFLKPS